MCLAPANLRYGLATTNSLIANSLDPLGDISGQITEQEIWFRSLGGLTWGQATTCEFIPNTRVPCRPSSSGHLVQTVGEVTKYTSCDVSDVNC